MATTPAYLHKIHQDRLCKLLEVDLKGLDKLIRRKGLPTSTDSDEHGPFWSVKTVREWLTSSHYRPLASLLLDWWPDAEGPASYCGAEPKRYHATDPEPAAVLQHWRTRSGATVVVCWPMPDHSTTVRRYLHDWAPNADAYLTIGVDWGPDGPSVWAERGDQRGNDDDEIEWADLARVLGQPAPFWPDRLRHPDLITSWAPGNAPTHRHGVPAVNIDPLLRMAALYSVDHPVHKTMIHYAQVIQAGSDATESVDVGLLRERFDNGLLTPEQLTVAAKGLPVPQVDLEDLPALTRRIAWREVLDRDDVLAEQCVSAAREWNGGKDTSHPHTIQIARTAAGQEFLSRLQPSPRLAMFIILDPDRKATPMVDPLTDSPVAVPADEGEPIRASAPNRLPTTSPLAELILEHPIWIRTADGTLYPAPYDRYYGLSWGYGGTGPATLAELIRALLDDITAYGAGSTEADHPPEGLLTLVRHKWPAGTVLTRDQLEAARDGHPDIPE
jgi:hypothetical protein